MRRNVLRSLSWGINKRKKKEKEKQEKEEDDDDADDNGTHCFLFSRYFIISAPHSSLLPLP